jgi:NADH:ubiquinone oxidoreductase subunit H
MGYIDVIISRILVWQIYVLNLSFNNLTENEVFRIEVLGISGEFLIRLFLELFIIIVIVFLRVCFLTILERKVLGYVQNRKGPSKILFTGILQPVIDGGKLILKRIFIEKIIVIRFLRIRIWFFRVRVVINNAIFFILIISSIIVYVLFILG